ncbi:MAG: alpha-L-glutamate ligase [Gammaproteobacteria bacterium]|nr:alpha-L-glutamate ligase [Gammaproteobacteria bacterium]
MNESAERDPRVVLFTDDPGWHGRMLVRALAARGLEAVTLSLKSCYLAITGGVPRLFLPGFNGALPRGAFVRGVPGGSLEEVVLRLDVLHWLAQLGVPVFNSGRAIERTVDKAMTSFRLALHGLATPRTWVSEWADRADTFSSLFADQRSIVLKPLFGSQGEGILRIDSTAELTAVTPVGGVFYAQEYVARSGPPFSDWRVLVIAGRAEFAMERRSTHWITNRALGADCVSTALTLEMAALAEAAAAALDIDYAGVDLMRDVHGRWWIGEVNGVPAWWGLARATGLDVTARLVDAFCAKLERGCSVGDLA